MSEITFSVAITPEPQGSTKAFIIEGQLNVLDPCDASGKPNWVRRPRAIVTSDNPDLKSYRAIISAHARNAIVRSKMDAPMAPKHVGVCLDVQFVFVKPPSVTKKRLQMVVRPDVDKCLRSTMDALTGILYLDDSQVVEVTTRKSYGEVEGVRITARIVESDIFATPRNLPLVDDF
jgi:Holliday junction resolvase RusA-like endonuclease